MVVVVVVWWRRKERGEGEGGDSAAWSRSVPLFSWHLFPFVRSGPSSRPCAQTHNRLCFLLPAPTDLRRLLSTLTCISKGIRAIFPPFFWLASINLTSSFFSSLYSQSDYHTLSEILLSRLFGRSAALISPFGTRWRGCWTSSLAASCKLLTRGLSTDGSWPSLKMTTICAYQTNIS